VNWLALIVAPSIALITQSIAYALVTPSCQHDSNGTLHTVAIASFLVASACTLIALTNWRRLRSTSSITPFDAAERRELFLARVATMVGIFSSLVIFAMALPIWVVSPCQS
jgi:hypothetical protein